MLAKKRSANSRSTVNVDLLTVGTQMLKFGVKGNPQEKVIRLSKDRRYLTWSGKIFSMKKDTDRKSE